MCANCFTHFSHIIFFVKIFLEVILYHTNTKVFDRYLFLCISETFIDKISAAVERSLKVYIGQLRFINRRSNGRQ